MLFAYVHENVTNVIALIGIHVHACELVDCIFTIMFRTQEVVAFLSVFPVENYSLMSQLAEDDDIISGLFDTKFSRLVLICHVTSILVSVTGS